MDKKPNFFTGGEVLPVSVILPVKDCIDDLPGHLWMLSRWVDRCAQVVVVDSSTDGSLDFIKEKLVHPDVIFLSTPQGLYESWNQAVSVSKSDYVYISTVGESIQTDGIETLIREIIAHDLDIIISPPQIYDSAGKSVEGCWPVHSFCQGLPSRTRLLSRSECIQWMCAFLPMTLLGSSAGNLYRRKLFDEAMFPVSYGSAGDAAWGVIVSTVARVGVSPGVFSTFHLTSEASTSSAKKRLELISKFKTLLGFTQETAPANLKVDFALARQNILRLEQDLLCLARMEESLAGINGERRYFQRLESEHQSLANYVRKLEKKLSLPLVRIATRLNGFSEEIVTAKATHVTAILPCRDNAPEIREHICSMKKWAHLVDKVIVVDSSKDDTPDILRDRPPHPCTEIHTVSPGLYQAWNHGAALAESEFVYYSTVGDMIEAADLEMLIEGIKEHAADVLIAPPRLITDSHIGATSPSAWPIHHLAKAIMSREQKFAVVSPECLGLLCCVLAPISLIGSSASNIYRTSFLKENPWPLDFGHAGDAGWLCRNYLRARVVLCASTAGSFRFHHKPDPDAATTHAALATKMREATFSTLQASINSGTEAQLSPVCSGMLCAADDWIGQLWSHIGSATRSLQEALSHAAQVRDEIIETPRTNLRSLLDQLESLEALHHENLRKINEEIAREREYYRQLDEEHAGLVAYVQELERRLKHPLVKVADKISGGC